MKVSDGDIRALRTGQREMLLRHVNRPVEVNIHDHPQIRISLLAKGLLRGYPTDAARPRHTVLTEHGRYAACLILGDYADALVAAGFLDFPLGERPLAMLQRWKAERSQMNPAKSPNLKNSTKPESSSSDIGR